MREAGNVPFARDQLLREKLIRYSSSPFNACLPPAQIASKVTLDPLQLVRVRLARAECLAEAGFPAEAASALAGVLSGKNTPKTTGGYAGRRYSGWPSCSEHVDDVERR